MVSCWIWCGWELAQFKEDVADIKVESLSLPGAPVSVDDIMENLQRSEAQAKAGQVFTSEEVKNASNLGQQNNPLDDQRSRPTYRAIRLHRR